MAKPGRPKMKAIDKRKSRSFVISSKTEAFINKNKLKMGKIIDLIVEKDPQYFINTNGLLS